MAWQIYQRSLEWEEVSRAEIDDTRRVVNKNSLSENTVPQSVPQLVKSSSRSRLANQRKCTNLAHLLTLRCQGIKSGSSTICKECSQEISWENLNRDGRSR